ncbi:NAD(P)-dependent oxidoreductase [Cellulomonas timonensis]|uniref:NAD(P)-dependent oxidoreductase n=1 Tax=Cellulomonas timonensis TaxID=1689271 RepID=UPI000829E285|nr:NAD(P)H-binding protein [Cellulomonas timonensis]
MARITVIGGTGYAGSHIVREAVSRGHQVTSISRNAPVEPVPGASYVTGDVFDTAVLERAVADTDVVVETLSPRGELEGKLVGVVRALATAAQDAGARIGVVGGAGSLLVSEGGPTVASTDEFPDAFTSEAAELAEVLSDLRAADATLDWFFLSPAGNFGPWAAGEHTGEFRIGGDVLLVDSEGNSNISGADYAQAFVDEIENPAHSRQRFTVAY